MFQACGDSRFTLTHLMIVLVVKVNCLRLWLYVAVAHSVVMVIYLFCVLHKLTILYLFSRYSAFPLCWS